MSNKTQGKKKGETQMDKKAAISVGEMAEDAWN